MALKQKGAEALVNAKKRRCVGFTQIAADDPPPCRCSRIRRHIRSYLHRSSSDPQPLKPLATEDFVVIAHIEIVSVEMKFKDRWLACLSLGERTYRTAISAVLRVLAREISALPSESDAREVLVGMSWDRFLRKGSLSMVIRELGHMGLPDRALQTLCWAQTHRPHLFPDDRSLASAVEVLARSGHLKTECQLEEYVNSASRTVVEAMARGFIRAGHLHRARKLLLIVKDSKRMLDASIHAKLIHEAAKTPDGYRLASALLDELAEREESELKLNPQDCTMLMKVCIKLGRFEAVENLFRWYKASGREASIVMYTTVLHGRYRGGEYREGMALVWEMEGMDCLFDLPAFRVVIRLCIASGDFARAGRYFSRMKEAGFTPTYDVYRDMMGGYARTGRWAKCRQICKEVEAAGMKLDGETSLLVAMKQGEAG